MHHIEKLRLVSISSGANSNWDFGLIWMCTEMITMYWYLRLGFWWFATCPRSVEYDIYDTYNIYMIHIIYWDPSIIYTGSFVCRNDENKLIFTHSTLLMFFTSSLYYAQISTYSYTFIWKQYTTRQHQHIFAYWYESNILRVNINIGFKRYTINIHTHLALVAGNGSYEVREHKSWVARVDVLVQFLKSQL